jgi:protein-disulfide isomerase
MHLMASRRALLLAAASAALLSACGGGGASKGAGVTDDDITIGAANAPVHVVEYASATCPHCAEFHESNWEILKSEYIDAGKVKFTLREFATPPPQIAVAGFQVARCGDPTPEEYYTRLGAIFSQQRAILGPQTMQGAEAALVRIGQLSNLSPEQVRGCIRDTAGTERVQEIMDDAQTRGVDSTPTFFINDEKASDEFRTPDGMRRLLDAALANGA